MSAKTSFNLIDEAWIPVLDLQGQLVEISLRQALCHAADYLAIEGDSPLETVAMYRLLFAILHRALKGPTTARENADWFRKGFPDSRIKDYLKQFHARFDLFDSERPFYQLPALPEEGYVQHWSKLSAAEGSGNTTPIFNPALRKQAPEPDSCISPAQAARKLLEHQTFVLGGLIKKFITSAPGGPSATNALMVIRGRTMHETLCLNLAPYKDSDEILQLPVWETEPYSIDWLKGDPSIRPLDIAQLYTWFARSVRFLPENREGRTVVRKIAYASGIRPQFAAEMDDPMVTYTQHDKGYSALSLKEGKGFWRDYLTLIPGGEGTHPAAVLNTALELYNELQENHSQPQTMIFGQYNDQAKILFWRQEQYPLPPALFSEGMPVSMVRSLITDALEQAEEAFAQLNGAVKKLARHLLSHSGREPDYKKDILPLCKTFPHQAIYWSRLESAFVSLLQQLGTEAQAVLGYYQWLKAVRKTGDEAWEQTARASGQDTLALRAAALAQPFWLAHKAKLNKLIEANEPVSVPRTPANAATEEVIV